VVFVTIINLGHAYFLSYAAVFFGICTPPSSIYDRPWLNGYGLMVNTRNLVDMSAVNNRGQYGLGMILKYICSVFVLV
jgi:hypothetical protein